MRIVTLNRPEARNALSSSLRSALRQEIDRAEQDGAVRAIVLTGAGSAFCAGLDLAELESLLDRSAREHREDARDMAELLLRIYRLPKPVIAAVNGPAIAGGAGLASVCDLVVASESATFGYSEVRIGFVAALVGVFLVRQIGERRARELLLGARRIAASEALSFGMVNEVVADSELLDRATEWGSELARHAPAALALSKRLLADTGGVALAAALDTAVEINSEARGSADLREGIRAFLDKRAPHWQRDPPNDEAG